MRFLKTAGFALISTGLISAAPLAAAQSSDFENSFHARGAEARVSLTIPFGSAPKSSKSTAPKLGFGVRQYAPQNTPGFDWALNPNRTSSNSFRDSQMTMTLTKAPEFALNDQVIYTYDPETLPVSDDVKTAGKIALGAGILTVVVIGGAFAFYVLSYDGDGT